MGVSDGVLWETCTVDGCRGVRLGDEGHCLQHCSDDVLGQVVSSGAEAVDIDGRGVTFDGRSLSRLLEAIPRRDGRRWVGSARFDAATFEHEAPFDEITFRGPASFVGATFAADARFGGAAFEADVSFEGATFDGQAWFVGATFRGPVSFSGVGFAGPAWFQRTAFAAGARFDRATFVGNVTFTGATFAAVSSFSAAGFRSLAVFDKVVFAAPSSWDDATFSVDGQGPPEGVEVPKPTAPPTVNGQYLDTLAKAPRPVPRAAPARRSRRDGSRLLGVLLPLLGVAVLAATAFIVLRPSGGPVTTDEVQTTSTVPGATAASSAVATTATTLTALGDAAAYTLDFVDAKGKPARFNRCDPVRYVVNPAGAPAGWQAVLQQALREVEGASGLRFEDTGTTDETARFSDPPAPGTPGALPGGAYVKTVDRPSYQRDRYPDGWAPILIHWADLTPGVGATPGYDTSGFGGSDRRINADGNAVYVSGVVVIAKNVDPPLLKSVLMHELGHILGLAHTSDPFQVMAATHTAPPASWGAGDLTGLAKVGRESDCVKVPKPE